MWSGSCIYSTLLLKLLLAEQSVMQKRKCVFWSATAGSVYCRSVTILLEQTEINSMYKIKCWLLVITKYRRFCYYFCKKENALYLFNTWHLFVTLPNRISVAPAFLVACKLVHFSLLHNININIVYFRGPLRTR